jgi:hypothetical protein
MAGVAVVSGGPQVEVNTESWARLRVLLRRQKEGFDGFDEENKNLDALWEWILRHGSTLIASEVALDAEEQAELGRIEQHLIRWLSAPAEMGGPGATEADNILEG